MEKKSLVFPNEKKLDSFINKMNLTDKTLISFLKDMDYGTKNLETYQQYLKNTNKTKSTEFKSSGTASTIFKSLGTSLLSTGINMILGTIIDSISNSYKQIEEAKGQVKEHANNSIEEENNIQTLINEYNNIDIGDRSTDNTEIIKNLNDQINQSLGTQAEKIDLVNGKLDEQSNKLKRNFLLKLKEDKGEIDANAAIAESDYDKGLEQGFFGIDPWGNVSRILKENGVTKTIDGTFWSNIGNTLEKMDADKSLS